MRIGSNSKIGNRHRRPTRNAGRNGNAARKTRNAAETATRDERKMRVAARTAG
jgi:hypothetical protein